MVTRMNQPLGGKYVGAGGALLAPDQVAQQKQVAAALLDQAGDTSPVGHWTAGLNRVVQGFLGGRDMYRARQAESEGTSKALERFNARNSGAGAASRVAEALAGGKHSPNDGHDHSGMTSSDWLRYTNQNATRNKPLASSLVDAMSFLPELGLTMEVYSGGQDADGPNRTGSTRHDHGNAADVMFYDANGRMLDWNSPEDIPVLQNIVSTARSRGVTGFGAGDDYMGAGRMHIGFGNEGVWGAGGKGANAPEWLRAAFNGGAGAGISQAPAASNVSEIAALLADPWLPKDAKAVLQAEMNQQMQMQNAAYEMQLQQQDPLRQIQLQQERLKLDQMLNPVSDYDQRSAVADQFGLQGDARRAFILTGEIPGTPEGFTLGEGQMRFDANGNLIASGGEKTPSLDEYQKYVQEAKDSGQPVLDRLSYEQAKKGKGFSMTLPDGTVVQMGGPQGPGPEFSDTGAFDINTVLSDIDAILASDLARITGPIQGAGGNMVDELAWPQRLLAGEEGLTTIERIGNLQNKTWMAARSMLKGGGSITDYESRKAEGAMARLSRVKSESEMRSALKDLRDAVVEGQRKLAKARGVNAPSSDAEKPQQAEPEQPKPRRRYNPQTRSFE